MRSYVNLPGCAAFIVTVVAKHLNSSSIKIENKIECDTLSHSCLFCCCCQGTGEASYWQPCAQFWCGLTQRALTPDCTTGVWHNLHSVSVWNSTDTHEPLRYTKLVMWGKRTDMCIFLADVTQRGNCNWRQPAVMRDNGGMLCRCETNSLRMLQYIRLHTQPGCKYFQGHIWTT